MTFFWFVVQYGASTVIQKTDRFDWWFRGIIRLFPHRLLCRCLWPDRTTLHFVKSFVINGVSFPCSQEFVSACGSAKYMSCYSYVALPAGAIDINKRNLAERIREDPLLCVSDGKWTAIVAQEGEFPITTAMVVALEYMRTYKA